MLNERVIRGGVVEVEGAVEMAVAAGGGEEPSGAAFQWRHPQIDEGEMLLEP